MISIATSSLCRVVVSPFTRHIITRRHLSMTCSQSLHKLNDILEEYRSKNYTQELPRRFRMDIVKAASLSSSSNAAVSADGLECVLNNIGFRGRISRSELDGIVSECGTCPIDDSADSSQCVISENQMLNLISKDWEASQLSL
eukprot:77017_1